MTRLIWATESRHYESGIDKGVFYPKDSPGHAWNGLVSVEETSDSKARHRYLDGVRIGTRNSPGAFTATLQAFTYPEAMVESLDHFGFSYRVRTDRGYLIHLVYNARATPFEFDYVQQETSPFSWEISTRPMLIPNHKPSSHFIIDTSIAYESTIQDLEDILYGSDGQESSLPSHEDLLLVFEENSLLRIIDHGDGTWTAIGPDEAIQMLNASTFEITWPSAVYLDTDLYQISSF